MLVEMIIRPSRSVGKGLTCCKSNSELIGIINLNLEHLVLQLCTIDLFYSWNISGYLFEGKNRYACHRRVRQ